MLDYTDTTVHFKLMDEIGQDGQNSSVFKAHDFQLDAEIVVKRIDKKSFKDAKEFFDEAKILYTSTHPNVVPIQYSCHDNDFVYITMPLFKTGSLSNLIDSRPLKPSEIIKYSIDFLSGLHHIHTKGLVHCDIKPNNILLSDTNDAMLSDFGISRYLNSTGNATADKFYHWHTAPETSETGLLSTQSDIYQVAVTIYRMCNGNQKFTNQISRFAEGSTLDLKKFYAAVQQGNFPDRSQYLAHIPQKLRNYIRKAMEIDPIKDMKRYWSYSMIWPASK